MKDMNNAATTGDTGNNIHTNVAFYERIVVWARGSIMAAWAMGWLNGAGCSGYRMPRLASNEVRQAYREGQEEGRAAKAATV
jgi:hypothetical protein